MPMATEQPRGFGRALKRAANLSKRKEALSSLMETASRKAAQKKEKLGEAWQDLGVFFELIKDWSSGRYKGISTQNMLVIIGAVIYFVNPFDAIPDFIIGYGFLDDITVIGYVLNSMKKEIQLYRDWMKDDYASDDQSTPSS